MHVEQSKIMNYADMVLGSKLWSIYYYVKMYIFIQELVFIE
jgi:hypothetical protein